MNLLKGCIERQPFLFFNCFFFENLLFKFAAHYLIELIL